MTLRRSRVSPLAFAFFAASAGACGGASTTTHPPVTTVPGPAAEANAPLAPTTVDVSAVPAPRALVVSIRLTSPKKLLDVAGAWAQVPMPDADYFAQYFTGQATGDILDLDQPVDMAIGAQGKGLGSRRLAAIAAAVRNGDEARAAFAKARATEHGDGAVRFHGGGGDDGDDDGGDHVCELGPAFGAAPVRLVCARDDASLDAFSAYLRRTAPRASYASDIHVEARMAPVRDMLGGQRNFAAGGLTMLLGGGAGLRQIAQSAVDFAYDLDTVGIDLQATPSSADASASFKFSGAQSVLTRLATAHPERTDVAPAAFWSLPIDAHAAFFHRGVDEATFAAPRDALLELGAKVLLPPDGVTSTDHDAVVAALREMTSGAPAVYASGVDVQAASTKLAAVRSLAYAGGQAYADALRDASEALLGWRVLGVEEPASKFSTASRDLVAAWSSPSIARAYKAASAPQPQMKIVPMPAGAQLPAGGTHLEIDVTPSGTGGYTYYVPYSGLTPNGAVPPPPLPPPPPYPAPSPPPTPPRTAVATPRPIRIHVLFVPDGTRTWALIGCDPAALVAKARVVLPSGAPDKRLGARTDLERLKTEREGSGGFVSVLSGVTFFAQLRALLDGDVGGVADAFQALGSSGAAPLPYTMTAQPDGTFVASFHIPPAGLDEVRTALMTLMH